MNNLEAFSNTSANDTPEQAEKNKKVAIANFIQFQLAEELGEEPIEFMNKYGESIRQKLSKISEAREKKGKGDFVAAFEENPQQIVKEIKDAIMH